MKGCQESLEKYRLIFLLARTRDVLYAARVLELKQYGITPYEASTLYLIQALGDKATYSELAKQTFRQYVSIHSLLKKMINADLVKKVTGPGRTRGARLALTPKGERVFQEVVVRGNLVDLIDKLSITQRKQLNQVLEKLLEEGSKYFGVMQKPIMP